MGERNKIATVVDTHCVGAILLKGGEDTDEPYDVWRFTNSFNAVDAAPDAKCLVAADQEELERLIENKYPAPPGTTYLVPYRGDLLLTGEDVPTYYRRGRRHRVRQDATGLQVLKYPLVLNEDAAEGIGAISLSHVQDLCVEYGTVLITSTTMKSLEAQAGGVDLRELGFVRLASATSGSRYRLRWSALNSRLQQWREQVVDIKKLLVPHFTEDAVRKIGYCVNPSHWPESHPYAGLLKGKDDHGWDGQGVGRRGSRNYEVQYTDYKVGEILRLIAVNKKLCPKLTPWREANGRNSSEYGHYDSSAPSFSGLPKAIELCFQNIWAVEDRLKKEKLEFDAMSKKDLKGAKHDLQRHEQERAFCRWLRKEAKVAGVAVPKPPKLPKKPTRRTADKMIKLLK